MTALPPHRDPALYAEALALISRLYRALDAGDEDTLVSCFADGAVWHRPNGPQSGEAALRSIATNRAAERVTLHIPSNLALTTEGGRLVGRYYLTVYGTDATVAPHLNTTLECEDSFAAGADGLRVAEKRTWVRMMFA